jgi:hypothetical protein
MGADGEYDPLGVRAAAVHDHRLTKLPDPDGDTGASIIARCAGIADPGVYLVAEP